MVYLDVFKVSPQMAGSEYITRVFIGGRKSPKGLQMLKMKEICSELQEFCGRLKHIPLVFLYPLNVDDSEGQLWTC